MQNPKTDIRFVNGYLRAEPILIGSALTCIIQGFLCMSTRPAATGIFADRILSDTTQNKPPN